MTDTLPPQSGNRQDATPIVVRVFYGFVSGMAIVNASLGLVIVAVALKHITSAPARPILALLLAGFFGTVGFGIFLGSRMLWLSASPHADPEMRRWRRLYFKAWTLALCLFGALWLVLPGSR